MDNNCTSYHSTLLKQGIQIKWKHETSHDFSPQTLNLLSRSMALATCNGEFAFKTNV